MLRDDSGEWRESVSKILPDIPAQSKHSVEQQIQIKQNARCHEHVIIGVELYLSSPKQTAKGDEQAAVITHQMDLVIQVSELYVFRPLSSFLLITNSETTRSRSQALQRFIREDLGMEVDVWNIALYGSLRNRDPVSNDVRHIISAYHGKSIIVLNNRFEFFDCGSKSSLELCDPHPLADALEEGTNCLFLDTKDFKPYDDLLKSSMFCLRYKVKEVNKHLVPSRRFENVKELVSAVREQKQHDPSNTFTNYTLPTREKLLGIITANPESQTKRISRYLRRHLPSERCLVTFSTKDTLDLSNPDNEKSPVINVVEELSPQIIVSCGLPYHGSVVALEPCRRSNDQTNSQDDQSIDPFEGYMIVNSLPLSRRVDLLWNSEHRNGAQTKLSDFALDSIGLSITRAVNKEIHALFDTSSASWSDNLVPSSATKLSAAAQHAFLATNLPALAALLRHPEAANASTRPGPRVVSVLHHALASTQPQKKRQVAAALLPALERRRARTRALLAAAVTRLLESKQYAALERVEFFEELGRIHSVFDGERRDTAAVIARRLVGHVKRSGHVLENGVRDASGVVGRSTSMKPGMWDERVEWARRRAGEVRKDEEAAKRVLGRMQVDEPDDVELEEKTKI